MKAGSLSSKQSLKERTPSYLGSPHPFEQQTYCYCLGKSDTVLSDRILFIRNFIVDPLNAGHERNIVDQTVIAA